MAAACLSIGQITPQGKGYLFRVSFTPKQKAIYSLTNRIVGSTQRTVPRTITMNCTEIVQGLYHVEVTKDPPQDSDDQPEYRKMWVTNRGHSSHPTTLWFTNCPYGPIKLRTPWKGYPPPFAESLGAPKYSGFDYRLMGFQKAQGRQEAIVAFNFVEQTKGKKPVYRRYTGSLLLDTSNGQILDLTVTKTEPNPDRTATPNVLTTVTRAVRV